MKTIEQIENKIYENDGNTTLLSLVPPSSKFILDVGCGAGGNAKRLKEMGKIVDGITLSDEELKLASKYCRKVLKYNLENGLPSEIDSHYDVVICSHVLEHIAYPEKLLFDIKSKLKHEDSILLIALPNFLSYRNRLKILFGNFDYEQYGIMDYTHLRFYTFKSAKLMIERNGFEVINAFAEKMLPWKTVLGHLPSSIQNLIATILVAISKGLFGSQLIYIARPKL